MVESRTRPAFDGQDTLAQGVGSLTEIQRSIGAREATGKRDLSLVLWNSDRSHGEHGRQCSGSQFAGDNAQAGAQCRPALARQDFRPNCSMDGAGIEFADDLLHRDAGLSQPERQSAFDGRGAA